MCIRDRVKGTTTDPVLKSMELLPLGPVVMMDTPGIDDTGDLGALRVKKSYQALNKTDLAVLVIDGTVGALPQDAALLERIRAKNLPWIVVLNKIELLAEEAQAQKTHQVCQCLRMTEENQEPLWVSAQTGQGIFELKERIAALGKPEESDRKIVADLVCPGDFVVLVVPIDKAAPKGRLILPQQQTIRDLLEAGVASVVVRETELADTLSRMGTAPALVITDSQAFGKVSKITPADIPLTSFSILFARYKGTLEAAVRGVRALDTLKDGDRVLICEGCTHHRQCDDIGTVKLPNWIRQHTGASPAFSFTSGTEFPEDVTDYHMVIHCGGCMLNEREMRYRLSCAQDQGVPMTNYGIAIAYIHGILKRSVAPFPEIAALLE